MESTRMGNFELGGCFFDGAGFYREGRGWDLMMNSNHRVKH